MSRSRAVVVAIALAVGGTFAGCHLGGTDPIPGPTIDGGLVGPHMDAQTTSRADAAHPFLDAAADAFSSPPPFGDANQP